MPSRARTIPKTVGLRSRLNTFSSSSDSSSSDSSDDESLSVDQQRYITLRLQQGLQHRETRIRALQELREIFRACYTLANKVTQGHMVTDLHAAIRYCDERPIVTDTLTDAVRAASKVLPQQKRQQVDKEHKQAMLRAARARQRARTLSADTDSSASESECEGGSERVTEPLQTPVYTVERGWPLPDGITHRVMCCVSDPYTLARATCVSRTWRRVITHSGLWRGWCLCVYGNWGVGARILQAAQAARQTASASGPTPVLQGIVTALATATPTHSTAPTAGSSDQTDTQGPLEMNAVYFAKLVSEDPDTVKVLRPYTRLFCNGTLVWTDITPTHTDTDTNTSAGMSAAASPVPQPAVAAALSASPLRPCPALLTPGGRLPEHAARRLTVQKISALTCPEVVEWLTCRLVAGRLRLPQWLRLDIRQAGARARMGSRTLISASGADSSDEEETGGTGIGRFWAAPPAARDLVSSTAGPSAGAKAGTSGS